MLRLRTAVNERGSIHIQLHTPCQDRYLIRSNGQCTLFTLADGHGSAPHTRSGLGARLMCSAAARVLLADGAADEPDAVLTAALKDTYDRLVRRHLALRPLADWELERLQGRPPEQVYGCTFLAALSTPQEVICLQVGDGTITLLDEMGMFLPPLERDDFCTGALTSSMAYDRECCLAHFRVRRYPQPVAALLMHSDGYCFSGRFPYRAAGLLALNGAPELEAVLRKGRRGDDLTFLLAADDVLTATEAFQSGLTRTLRRGERLEQAAQIKMEMERTACYLRLALSKYHAAADKAQADAWMAKIRPRAEAYRAALSAYEELKRE